MARAEESVRQMEFARALRPNDSSVLYNCACAFCKLRMKREAMDALRKAWDNGFKDAQWARRDPDLALLHGDPEFERLYPEPPPA
jgi:non-specific serine/threonine protein kinase